MKQLTKKIAIMTAICCVSFAAFANGQDQLPIRKTFSTVADIPLQVDLQWVPATETLMLLADNPAGKRVFITLRDESGSALTRVVIPGSQKKIERYYSFAGAEEGKYTIDIFNGSKTITKKFNLQRVQRTETIVSIF